MSCDDSKPEKKRRRPAKAFEHILNLRRELCILVGIAMFDDVHNNELRRIMVKTDIISGPTFDVKIKELREQKRVDIRTKGNRIFYTLPTASDASK